MAITREIILVIAGLLVLATVIFGDDNDNDETIREAFNECLRAKSLGCRADVDCGDVSKACGQMHYCDTQDSSCKLFFDFQCTCPAVSANFVQCSSVVNMMCFKTFCNNATVPPNTCTILT